MTKSDNPTATYTTRGGVQIERTRRSTEYGSAIDTYLDALDDRVGAVLSSNYEYPGRYTRWDFGFVESVWAEAGSRVSVRCPPRTSRSLPLDNTDSQSRPTAGRSHR